MIIYRILSNKSLLLPAICSNQPSMVVGAYLIYPGILYSTRGRIYLTVPIPVDNMFKVKSWNPRHR